MIQNSGAVSQQFLTNLQLLQQQMAATQQQISSGNKISQASDAPNSVGDVLQLESDLGRVNQVTSNLNLVSGEVAKRITGSESTFSIRPEKIHLAAPDENVESDMFCADGKVRDVIYLGLYTRYLVELENGGDLVVVEQNLKTTSMDVMKIKSMFGNLLPMVQI